MKAKKISTVVPTNLVKADVYGAQTPEVAPINQQPSALDATKTAVGDVVRRGLGLIDDVLADAILGDVSSTSIKKLLRSEFPDIKNTLDGLKENVIKEFAGSLGIKPAFLDKARALGKHPSKQAIESVLTEQFPQIKIIHQQLDPSGTTGSLYELAQSARTTVKGLKEIDTSREILGMVDSIVGDSTIGNYFNLTKEFQALSSVIRVASVYGVPEAVDKAINRAQEENRPALVVEAFQAAAVNGDFETLQRFAAFDLSGIRSKHPNIVRNVLEGYRGDVVTLTRYNAVIAILDRLDPNWLQAQNVYRYDDLCYASDAMVKLLGMNAVVGSHAVTATLFKPEAVEDSIYRTLPWVPLLA